MLVSKLHQGLSTLKKLLSKKNIEQIGCLSGVTKTLILLITIKLLQKIGTPVIERSLPAADKAVFLPDRTAGATEDSSETLNAKVLF